MHFTNNVLCFYRKLDKILIINFIWKEYKTKGESLHMYSTYTWNIFKGVSVLHMCDVKRQQAQKNSSVLSPHHQTEMQYLI